MLQNETPPAGVRSTKLSVIALAASGSFHVDQNGIRDVKHSVARPPGTEAEIGFLVVQKIAFIK